MCKKRSTYFELYEKYTQQCVRMKLMYFANKDRLLLAYKCNFKESLRHNTQQSIEFLGFSQQKMEFYKILY